MNKPQPIGAERQHVRLIDSDHFSVDSKTFFTGQHKCVRSVCLCWCCSICLCISLTINTQRKPQISRADPKSVLWAVCKIWLRSFSWHVCLKFECVWVTSILSWASVGSKIANMLIVIWGGLEHKLDCRYSIVWWNRL